MQATNFLRLRLVGHLLSFFGAPTADQSSHNSTIADAIRGQQPQALARFRNGPVELPEMTLVNAQVEVGYIVPGIGLRP